MKKPTSLLDLLIEALPWVEAHLDDPVNKPAAVRDIANRMRAAIEHTSSAPPHPLCGVLTRAGTFPIRDEETTGFVVSCSAEELQAIERLPMYQRVAIVDADALSFRCFEHVLRAHGLVDPCALDDPDGFDNYRTHGAVHAAHRELISLSP